MQRVPTRVAALAAGVSALMAACGGNDGGSPPPPPPAPASLSVSGTVATGAALAGGTVSATCATGSGSATTSATGAYTLAIEGGALPCVLEATGTASGGAAVSLHSVALGDTAQITPLTELVIAQATGAAPANLMTASAASLSTTFSATNVQAAQAKVLALLVAAGVDGAASLGAADLFAGALTIGSSTGYDHVLDGLTAALSAGGTSLATFTGTVATQASGGGSSPETASALAPELLLRPASPSCPSLRSGSYWIVDTHAAGDSGDGGGGFHRHTVDAAAGTITQVSDGTLYTLAPATGDSCHYTVTADDGSTGDAVVSPAGIVVARGNTSKLLLIGIPAQAHTPAEMAGDWNWVGIDTFDDSNAAWVYDYGQLSVSGSALQFQKGCAAPGPDQPQECFTAPEAAHTFQAAGDGGFLNSPTTGTWTDKLFAYQAGNGDWFAISSTCNIAAVATCTGGIGDGSLGFATRTHAQSLPVVGAVGNSWNVYLDVGTQLSTLTNDTSGTDVLSVDAAARSYTRTAGPIGGATHLETLFVDNPWDGFNFRDLATGVATSAGGTANVHKSYFLKTGVGLSVIVQPATANLPHDRLVLSVAQPAK